MPTTRSADKRKSASPAEKKEEKKKAKGAEKAAPEAEAASASETAKESSPPYAALALVPSIVSHDAEAHLKWVVAHIAGTEPCGEVYKDDKGLVMHGVVAVSNKHGKQHLYFGDAKCLSPNELDENKKSMLAEGEFCKGAQLHLNFDSAEEGTKAWDKANADGDVVVLMPYEPSHWGALYGLLRDPWGYVWAFCSPLPPKDDADNNGEKKEEEANGK